MAGSGKSSPRILKSSAAAKATALDNRISALLPGLASTISPTVVYLQGGDVEFDENGSTVSGGAWTCPEGVDYVQVECWGAGGGGGGGTLLAGGSGGGGGEYANEDNYPVVPGTEYSYTIGRPGQGGVSTGEGGHPGGDTVFDFQGTGVAGGVYAHGGMGGDSGSLYNGGTGSSNSRHYDGGAGGASVPGVSSDDPTLVSNLLLWWPLDDNSNTYFRDQSHNVNYGTPAATNSRTAAGIELMASSAPAQVPSTTTSVSDAGSSILILQDTPTPGIGIQAPSFALGSGSPSPQDGSTLTVSAWVQGDGYSSGLWSYGARYGATYGTVFANCDYPQGIAGFNFDNTSNGFALFLEGSTPGFYLGNGTVLNAIYSPTAFPAPDGVTWHQIVGTWDGTTQKLYVDGALVASATPAITNFAPGPSRIAAACNPYTKSDSYLCGAVSNIWLAATPVTSGFVAHSYGTGGALGGSGGGASGGSAAQGLAGVSATGSTGSSGGTAATGIDTLHGGSGAGGYGGNANNNAPSPVFVSPYGGGGGGAGTSASAGAVNLLTVSAQHSATYTGLDAAGGNVGQLYDISDTPQVGITNPYPAAALLSPYMYVGGAPSDSFNGTKNAMALLPNLVATLASVTVNAVTLSFTVQSTNASVLTVRYAQIAAQSGQNVPILPSSLTDADLPNGSYAGAQVVVIYSLVTVPIPAGAAGRRITFDVTDSQFLYFLSHYPIALLFGGCQGSLNVVFGTPLDIGVGSYADSDSYAWNTVLNGASSPDASDDVQLTFETYAASAANTSGSYGNPGRIALTYVTPAYHPVASVQAQETTDSQGNQHAAGITTDSIVAYDPTVTTVPRQPETWHSLGALSSGSSLTIDKARYRYSPEDGGTVVIQFSAFNAAGNLTAGTYTFANSLTAANTPSMSSTASHDQYVENMASINTGTGIIALLYVNGANFTSSPGLITLRVPYSIAATNPITLSAILRIPLT